MNQPRETVTVPVAMVQPIGPDSPRTADPAAIPPPPAESAPPPIHASDALSIAAPEREDIAAPVEAVPKVLAAHMAALGAR